MKVNSHIPNLKTKTHLIFDLDGTLIDSLNIWNVIDQAVLKGLNIVVPLDILQQEHTIFFKKENSYIHYAQFLIKNHHLEITPEEFLKMRWKIADIILTEQVDFKNGVVKILKKLKEQYVLILATSSTKHILSIYAHQNQKMAKRLCLETFFDMILTQEDIPFGKGKPEPDIYLTVLKKYSVKPEKCLIFEDSLEGVQAAYHSGIDVIHVNDPFIPFEDKKSIQKYTPYHLKKWSDFKI